ncbi:hypothetical protein HX039_12550 [Myroides marinus]|uniref:hypothetical protein n=1 Tax=Myroides marinus TaxID=703342 RepID=UPI002577754B|nr:hypothetical protein [Myroides marinus]MDM1404934.1 hypothetical protein [Myroides marinus]
MTYSKYLGNLVLSQFAIWKFEKKLQLADNITVSVVVDDYFLSDNVQLIEQVDLFVKQVLSAGWKLAFEELTEYLYYQLILKKGYDFDEHKFRYTTPLENVPLHQLWNYLEVEVVVLFEEDLNEWSFKFNVEGFKTQLAVVYTTLGVLVAREVNDWRTPLNTEYKVLSPDLRLYFYEDIDQWVSTQVISTKLWNTSGCRLYIGEDVFAIAGIEKRIINCIHQLKQKDIEEFFWEGASWLGISFNYTWQDYDKLYEEDLILDKANENRHLLSQLVAPPNRIEIALKGDRLILIHYNDCYWENEYGIHFIYDEELNLIAINEGNFYEG